MTKNKVIMFYSFNSHYSNWSFSNINGKTPIVHELRAIERHLPPPKGILKNRINQPPKKVSFNLETSWVYFMPNTQQFDTITKELAPIIAAVASFFDPTSKLFPSHHTITKEHPAHAEILLFRKKPLTSKPKKLSETGLINKELGDMIKRSEKEASQFVVMKNSGNSEIFDTQKHSLSIVFNNLISAIGLVGRMALSRSENKSLNVPLFPELFETSEPENEAFFNYSPLEHKISHLIFVVLDARNQIIEKLAAGSKNDRERMYREFVISKTNEAIPFFYESLARLARIKRNEYPCDPLHLCTSNNRRDLYREGTAQEQLESISFRIHSLISLKTPKNILHLGMLFTEAFFLERDHSISEKEHKKAIINLFSLLPVESQKKIEQHIRVNPTLSSAFFRAMPFSPAGENSVRLFREEIIAS